MSTPYLEATAFARATAVYLRHHRALGVRYRGVESVLSLLGRYLVRCGANDLNEALYEGWRRTNAKCHSNTKRRYEQIVRRFCLYRRRETPLCFLPSAEAFSRLRPYIRPVILTPEQVARMLSAADALPAHNKSPLHPAVARIATVLLFTTGLRSSELRALRVEDMDDQRSVLFIQESKFHKSRLLPLSPTTQAEVTRYLEKRALFAVESPDTGPFLCNRSRRGIWSYSKPGFGSLIQRLFQAAGVQDHEGRRPRVHDLRHSFAVQAVTRAYRPGADPQALLPKLALYMGHVSIESTMHYLQLSAGISRAASQRFEAAFGARLLGDDHGSP